MSSQNMPGRSGRTRHLIYEPKLNWDAVNFIRSNVIEYDRNFGCKAMALRFGVSVNTISKVVNGDTWKPRRGHDDVRPPRTRSRVLKSMVGYAQKMQSYQAELSALNGQ